MATLPYWIGLSATVILYNKWILAYGGVQALQCVTAALFL